MRKNVQKSELVAYRNGLLFLTGNEASEAA
jgi:hypothetical protein